MTPCSWHRYFLWLFEEELREVCDYRGSVPYWDWTQDAISEATFVSSPLFDPEYGFGGNGPYIADVSNYPKEWQTMAQIPGRTGGGCITDGPFARVLVSMGPGNHTYSSPHCLRRDFSPWLATQTLNASRAAFVMEAQSYFDLEHRIEGLALGVPAMSLHAGGHLGVGGQIGDIANTYSSPSDPLFYLHHGMLDRFWNLWQRNDWSARRSDIGGPDTQWAYPYNYFGDRPYTNITLDFEMDFGQIGGKVKVGSVMDIQGGPFCYKYS
ncbi:Di-copper centre-containing protein [Xylariomycetidae sp. FL0641]|nr:Di-copper centre-containing protein [Xylariomycetidae sp. FL0641]